MEGRVHTAEAVIDNGSFGTRTIRFETGRLARQAAGSAVAYLDDETMVLSATTASKNPKENLDFFPLTVDVEERMYAAGRIPGSFFRREGRPSEDAILTCRLIDRPLRPSFVKGLRNEIQVVVTIMALNPDHLYDVVAINAASMSTQLAGPAVLRPDRRRPRRADRGPVGGVPDPQPSCERAVFDMVVAGRVARGRRRRDHDGRGRGHRRARIDARSRDGAVAPTEEVVAQGLEAAKPFITVAVRGAGGARRAGAPSRPREFPLFLDYQDDVLEAVDGRRQRRAGPGADHRRQAGARDRARPGQGARRREARRPSSRAARRRSAPRSASLTKKLVRQRVIRDKVRIDGRGLTDIRTAVRRGRRRPAGARLGAVRARRDPDPGRHHAEHAPHGADDRHAQPRDAASATCTTTTSRRTPPVRPAASARRSAARSATARSPSGRCCRCCRRARSSPTRSARCPRRSAPTARPRWARSAPRRCRCSTPACRCKAPVAGIAMGLISDRSTARPSTSR